MEEFILNINFIMNENNNNGSLLDLEKLISNIGEDMYHIYSGVRENWWKLRQILIIDGVPDKTPSLIFKGSEENLSADDSNPCVLFSRENSCIYIWDHNSKSWIKNEFNANQVKSTDEDIILLSPLNKVYLKTLKNGSIVDFNKSLLNKKLFYEFKLILKTTSGEFSFSDKIIWNEDKKPVFKQNSLYIIKISIAEDVVLASIEFSSSKI